MPKTRMALIPRVLLLLLWSAGCAFAGARDFHELVVVVDTRVIDSAMLRYLADLYNTNITLFAVWTVVLTLLVGSILGLLMDTIMARTGLDLETREIIEL
ncbi:DVU0150 family protein [Desulfocurvus sp. DL9XJH121]